MMKNFIFALVLICANWQKTNGLDIGPDRQQQLQDLIDGFLQAYAPQGIKDDGAAFKANTEDETLFEIETSFGEFTTKTLITMASCSKLMGGIALLKCVND